MVPVSELNRHRLGAETRQLCMQALDAARQEGCPRLTTSFLLFALVEAGGEPQRLPLGRALRQRLLKANADAYHGVKAAYCGWYRSTCGRQGPAERPRMTPYIPRVLVLAEGLAGEAPVAPEHLLAALLDYDPGRDSVQPGIQYILAMIEPGLEAIRREFGLHRDGRGRETAPERG